MCLEYNFKEICKAFASVCKPLTEQTPAVNMWLDWNSTAPRLVFITAVSLLSSLSVQLLERPRPKQRWVSFHYKPLLSSVILIWKVCLAIDFHHLPKAWWTAAWSDNHIIHPRHLADINNRPFPSSLFGITRPYIRPNSCFLAAKLLEAPNSFSPYKVILFCKCNISRTPWGNFFKFGTKVHCDSRMTCLDFGGHRSKGKVTAARCLYLACKYFRNALTEFVPVW